MEHANSQLEGRTTIPSTRDLPKQIRYGKCKVRLISCTTLSRVVVLARASAQAATIQCTGGTYRGTSSSLNIKKSGAKQ